MLTDQMQTDQELYDSLPERLQGRIWASLPK
jgi:hypothetical protein